MGRVYYEEEKRRYYCSCCGKPFDTQRGNFNKTYSPLYAGNNGYVTVCNDCRDKYYNVAVDYFTGNEEKAIEQVCRVFDWYFERSACAATSKIGADKTRISQYPSKMALIKPRGETYLDTIRDIETIKTIDTKEDLEEIKTEKNISISKNVVKFWGFGFEPAQYKQLQDQYDDWTARHECKTKAQEELFKNLCIAQLNIQIAQQTNTKVSEAMKTFQDLLGSANLKPTQTNENTIADQNTFGTLIKKWENEKPISDPNPEWKDVDGIRKYINVWFLGHLCKMMGIKNSYSQEYEDEIAKYKVDKPEYFDDDVSENSDLDDMFNEGM